MVRIICIGNRFYYPDDFGIVVYEDLLSMEIQKDIELVEGGVGGMNLALYFEDDVKILIVDFGADEKKILTQDDIHSMKIDTFDHANAFLYLLKTITTPYTIYLCNEAYDRNSIRKYSKEVLEIARGLTCK